MTVLRFSGGETLHVGLSVPEVQKLLQSALADGVLLELKAPDGRVLVINPQQVQYLQAQAEGADQAGNVIANGNQVVPA